MISDIGSRSRRSRIFCTVLGLRNFESLPFEAPPQQGPNLGLVVDHQDLPTLIAAIQRPVKLYHWPMAWSPWRAAVW